MDRSERSRSTETRSNKDAAINGALASYGESYYALGRVTAKHVQQVLVGADPGTLPVEQFDRPEFVINLKTAKALGLTIPPALLLRADQVIACPEKAGASNGC